MTITGGRPSPGREARRELELVRRLVAGTVVATLAALPFLVLLFLVRTGFAPLADLDGRVAESFNGWARERPAAVGLLELLDRVTSPWTFRILVLVAAIILWRYGRRRLATWAVVTMTVGGILGVVLKVVVDRARPAFDQPVSFSPGLSYPSGHALNSMLGAAILLLLVLPVLSRRGRRIAWSAAVIVVLTTAFDRVALGAHFLTDVLGGWTLALALVVGTGTAFGNWRREHPAALDEVELEQGGTTDLELQATLREMGTLMGRALLAGAGLFVLMVAVGLLVTRVLDDGAALAGVTELTQHLAASRSNAGDTVSDVFSRLADTSSIVLTMLAVAGVLRLTLGRWREAAFVVMAVTLQSLVFVTTQLVVSRSRPSVLHLDQAAPTSSFPSGHTSAALALYGSLAIVLLWQIRPGRPEYGHARRWSMRGAAVLLLLVPCVVAWSRLYRGLHFPLDVVGSYLQAALSILVSARLVLRARLPEHLANVLDGR